MGYNRFVWNRHRYDIGAIDVESGKVMECHTEKQLAKWDFDAEFVFSEEQSEAINEGESVMFWVADDEIILDENTLVFEECELENKKDFLLENIAKQIKVLA